MTKYTGVENERQETVKLLSDARYSYLLGACPYLLSVTTKHGVY